LEISPIAIIPNKGIIKSGKREVTGIGRASVIQREKIKTLTAITLIMFGVKVSLAGILRIVTKTIKENNIFKILLLSNIFIANIIK
jgi:hypothetical protein